MNLEHRLFFRVDYGLYTQIKAYCKRTNTSVSELIRSALVQFFANMAK